MDNKGYVVNKSSLFKDMWDVVKNDNYIIQKEDEIDLPRSSWNEDKKEALERILELAIDVQEKVPSPKATKGWNHTLARK
ncbi:hypothetical protein CR513_32643, partial [Mucuna pruriens]